MKVLVVGSSGFLGTNLLCATSQATGMSALGLSRTRTAFRGNDPEATFVRQVESAVESSRPDVIINCVALVGHEVCDADPEAATRANVDIPKMLAELAERQSVGFVHYSTDAVFSGKPEGSSFSESDSPAPFSMYGLSKLRGEQAVLSSKPDSLILRTNFYGWSPTGNRGILEHFLRAFLSGEPAIGYGRYVVSSISASDLAALTIRAIQLNLNGVYHAAAVDSLSKYDFGRAVANEWGFPMELVADADPGIWRETGTVGRNLTLDVSKITAAGVVEYGQESGLGQTRESLRSFLEFTGSLRTDWRWALM